MPVWQDIAKYAGEVSGQKGIRFALAFDISRAHRQVPVREEDWGYLACRPDDTPECDAEDSDVLYINTVGTFGVGSAAYWWSRLVAVAVRAVDKIVCPKWLMEFLMYVDDGLLLAMGPDFGEATLGNLPSSAPSGSRWRCANFDGGDFEVG